MILRRHDPTINGYRLSQFIIIKLDSHGFNAELVDRIISELKGPECPEYCLLVGDYVSKSRIVKGIEEKYHIEWIGEHYCIASRIKKGYATVPRAVTCIYEHEHSFLLKLRSIKIICTNNTNTTPPDSDIHLHLLNLSAKTNLDGVCIDYEKEEEKRIMCISIPFYKLESLKACMEI